MHTVSARKRSQNVMGEAKKKWAGRGTLRVLRGWRGTPTSITNGCAFVQRTNMANEGRRKDESPGSLASIAISPQVRVSAAESIHDGPASRRFISSRRIGSAAFRRYLTHFSLSGEGSCCVLRGG